MPLPTSACHCRIESSRLRRSGFHEIVDTGEMLLDQLQQYREARILP